MDGNSCNTNSSDQSKDHLIWMMKLAVATTIIKMKPKHLSGQEYAKKLCNQFALSELNWRRKFEDIESELIKAKQQLILNEITPPPHSQPDALPSSEPIYLTPPPSLEAKSTDTALSVNIDKLKQHTKFLQGVSSLKLISKQSTGIKQLSTVTRMTITKSVLAIEDSIAQQDFCLVSSKCLLHAAETIATVCTQINENSWIEIKNVVLNLLVTLIKRLLNHDSSQEQCFQENLCEMFLSLGGIDRLQDESLDILLNHIEFFSDHLRSVTTKGATLDVVTFENMYHVLNLTQSLASSCKITPAMNQSGLYQRFNERLEDSLLHLTDQFPMFAQFIWRIGCLFISKSQGLVSTDELSYTEMPK